MEEVNVIIVFTTILKPPKAENCTTNQRTITTQNDNTPKKSNSTAKRTKKNSSLHGKSSKNKWRKQKDIIGRA
jgi:hypothetical protein